MNIMVPELGLSEQEVKQELAIALFQQDKLSLAQAAQFLGLTRLDTQQLLVGRRIPVQYTRTDWEDDLQILRARGEWDHYMLHSAP